MTATLDDNKKTSRRKYKVHHITDRFFVILDPRLVELLNIDEETWMEEEETEQGIILRIRNLGRSAVS